MRTKWLVLLVAALAALTLWGCGSNGGSGGSDVSDTDDPSNLDTVGATNCLVCQGRRFQGPRFLGFLHTRR